MGGSCLECAAKKASKAGHAKVAEEIPPIEWRQEC